MEKVRFDCPVCRKAYMVPPDRAENRMCLNCQRDEAAVDEAAKQLAEASRIQIAEAAPAREPVGFLNVLPPAFPDSQSRPMAIHSSDETEASADRYPMIVGLANVLAGLCVVLLVVAFFSVINLVESIRNPERMAPALAITLTVSLVVLAIVCLVCAESLRMAVNVANHVEQISNDVKLLATPGRDQ